MPSIIYRGTRNPLYQRLRRETSPTTGVLETHEWAGIGDVEMLSLEQQYVAAGFAVTFENRFGTYTLVARGIQAGGNAQANTIDVWEIAADDEIVTSLKNPRNVAGCATGEIVVIARALKDGTTIADAAAALLLDSPSGTFPTTLSAYGLRLWERLQTGSDGYLDSKYVLRHTTNVDNRYGVNIADLNVNRIYTTAQLLSEAQDTGLWIFPLPGRLAYKINALSSDFIARYGTLANYQWGWLKSASRENTSANNRVNIVTDYKFFNWSTDEYATA